MEDEAREKEEKIQHLKCLLVKQKKQSDWLKHKLEEQVLPLCDSRQRL